MANLTVVVLQRHLDGEAMPVCALHARLLARGDYAFRDARVFLSELRELESLGVVTLEFKADGKMPYRKYHVRLLEQKCGGVKP